MAPSFSGPASLPADVAGCCGFVFGGLHQPHPILSWLTFDSNEGRWFCAVHLKLPGSPETEIARNVMKSTYCLICGWIYDEAVGWPEDGIAAGTKWDDIPMNWTCPECGARKDDFEMVEL